jgi:mono/diheme cytochrome c family protein
MLCTALLLMAGCDDMTQQPKQTNYGPLVGPAAIPGGIVDFGDRPSAVPPLSAALLQRGQERYRIYCTPCHSELGDGHGMIVERGFPAPASIHIERLRQASSQYLYDVISAGYGRMYSFADRVVPEDRWAIVAYIRALQRSQHATPDDLSEAERGGLR